MHNTVTKIFSCLQKQNSNPKTELIYSTPFELLVAVILSAQATDHSVNKATKELFTFAKTPEDILSLGIRKLKNHIKTIGLYNTKASNIIKTCNILVKKHNSIVPNTREELEELPGVGRKTANVVLNEAFGQPTIAVDTHVFRVVNRLGIADGSTPLQVEKQLQQIIPEKFKQHAHSWLILHGRYICLARQPKCKNCVIIKLCKYGLKIFQAAARHG